MTSEGIIDLPQKMLLYAAELMEHSRASLAKDQNKAHRYLDFMERTLFSYGRLIVANEEANTMKDARGGEVDES